MAVAPAPSSMAVDRTGIVAPTGSRREGPFGEGIGPVVSGAGGSKRGACGAPARRPARQAHSSYRRDRGADEGRSGGGGGGGRSGLRRHGGHDRHFRHADVVVDAEADAVFRLALLEGQAENAQQPVCSADARVLVAGRGDVAVPKSLWRYSTLADQ